MAAKELGVETSRCWVVEDSEIGLTAGKAAGMRVVVTKSIYTREEDFRIADVIVDDLDKGLDGLVTISYLNYKSSTKAFNPASMTSSVQNAETFASKPGTNDFLIDIIIITITIILLPYIYRLWINVQKDSRWKDRFAVWNVKIVK